MSTVDTWENPLTKYNSKIYFISCCIFTNLKEKYERNKKQNIKPFYLQKNDAQRIQHEIHSIDADNFRPYI